MLLEWGELSPSNVSQAKMPQKTDTEERLWVSVHTSPHVSRVEGYLAYLAAFPLGLRNREAAEAVEELAQRLPSEEKVVVLMRLRALRDPHLPPIEPDS